MLILAIFLLTLAIPAFAQREPIKPPTGPAPKGGPAPTPKPSPTPVPPPKPVTERPAAPKAAPMSAGETAVRAAFDRLVEGIKAADVNKVMGTYWNSPRLTIYNYNGTVTRGWDQVNTNRQSSYPNLKDVVLEVRDVRVEMLGTDGAVLMYYWTQSQTSRGVSDTSTGRTTLVWRKIGTAWKIVHTHASPDNPDPSRLPPPEERETRPRTAPAGN
jgi:ketosteroid isomerase-like protein